MEQSTSYRIIESNYVNRINIQISLSRDLSSLWCDSGVPEKLQQGKVQHGRKMLAADEQRAAADCARSLMCLSSTGLQFWAWVKVHQLRWRWFNINFHHHGYCKCPNKGRAKWKSLDSDNILEGGTQKFCYNVSAFDFSVWQVMINFCWEELGCSWLLFSQASSSVFRSSEV